MPLNRMYHIVYLSIPRYYAMCDRCVKATMCILPPEHVYVTSPCMRFELFGWELLREFSSGRIPGPPDDCRFFSDISEFHKVKI